MHHQVKIPTETTSPSAKEINHKQTRFGLFFRSLFTVENPKTTYTAIALYSILFSFAICAPLWALENGVSKRYLVVLAIGIVCITFVTLLCVNSIVAKLFLHSVRVRQHSFRMTFCISFVALEAAFLIALLSNYPGLCSVDSNDIINQVLGNSSYLPQHRYWGLSNHHPVAYTFFVWLAFNITAPLGDLYISVFAFMLLQTTYVATLLAIAIGIIAEKCEIRWLAPFALCFFIFSPVLAAHVITMWKDVPFSAALLLLVVYIASLQWDGKLQTKQYVVLFLLVVQIALFRNNGPFVAILSLAFLACFFRKSRKAACLIACAITAIVLILHGPLFKALDIEEGHFSESVAIPLQQISATLYRDGNIGDDERAVLDNILPIEEWTELYDSTSPNAIKFADNFNDEYLDNNKVLFLSSWAKIAVSNASTYAKAWILQTYSYWRPGFQTEIGVNTTAFFNTPIDILKLDYKPQRISNDLRSLSSNLFSMGGLVWLTITCLLFAAIFRKNMSLAETLAPFVPLICLFLTILIAAPTLFDFRYTLSFYLVIPFLPYLLIHARQEQEHTKEGMEIIDMKSSSVQA